MGCVVDFKSPGGEWVGSYRSNNKQIKTRSYVLWHNIKTRSKIDGNYQSKRPTYEGCVNYFESYQIFASWCQNQVGYMEIDTCGRYWALDKDVLNNTSTIGYGPNNCCFIPIELNGLLQLQMSGQNDLPLGVVHRNRKRSPFSAQVNIEGKNVYLGAYKTKESAHKAWQIAKQLRIYAMISKYKTLVDKRVIDKLSLIAYNLGQDINLNKETVEFGGVPLAA